MTANEQVQRGVAEAVVVALEADDALMRVESVQPCGPEMVVHHYPYVVARVAARAAVAAMKPEPVTNECAVRASELDTFVRFAKRLYPSSFVPRAVTIADLEEYAARHRRGTCDHPTLAPQAEVLAEVRALPVVAHKGPYDTDASMFAEAAARLEHGFDVGGSNLTDAVVRLIRRELAILDKHEAKS